MIDDPRRILTEAEIIVTTVPRLSPRTHFLDAGLVAAGGFVSMVDSGVSWNHATLDSFDRRITDDVEQSTQHVECGNAVAEFDASLAEIVGQTKPGRRTPMDRIGLIFSGTGLADAAAGVAVYE